jgi:hypothetical protein
VASVSSYCQKLWRARLEESGEFGFFVRHADEAADALKHTPNKTVDTFLEQTNKLASNAPKGLPVPQVTNSKLKNLVDNLFKGTKVPNPIGTGSTADAVRNELRTGLPTFGRFHSQKAQETINGLANWLRKNPNASHSDRLVAQSLLDDLKAALGGN